MQKRRIIVGARMHGITWDSKVSAEEVFAVAGDHIHMFISYRPNQSASRIMQWLKGISSRVLLQEFSHLRKKF